MPGLLFLLVRAFAIVAVERELRLPKLAQDAALARDAMENLDRGIDDGVSAVNGALENDLEHFTRGHFRVERRVDRLFEWLRTARHRVLPYQHEEPRSRIERGSLTQSLDREIEPRHREMLVEAVALLDALFKRIALHPAACFERIRAVFRFQ
jgi:hypothetical protein